ncbi:hypothetical protein ABEP44_12530, partial [Cutibacterium acnes]
MNSIITVLIAYNQLLLAQIEQLLFFIVKNIPLKSPKYDYQCPKYNKHIVDKLPLMVPPEIQKIYDYKVILNNYRTHSGNELPPVKPRKDKATPPD